uniref:Nidogen n=1 Tax=Calidris pygmaea TaxID=425635 RepID=A0A8C3JVZ3_9CHAR
MSCFGVLRPHLAVSLAQELHVPSQPTGSVPPAGLISPEGLAVDHLRRAIFWTDSGLDKIERARLDGSERRVLFDTELVNPRAIAVDPVRGNLYWTDWNREAPKIETSTVNGANRRVLVNKDIGLPNGLTFDPFSKLLCWADAGTKHLECTFPDGTGRRVVQNNLNYPFSIISYANHFYHTDWRRDGVIAIDKETGSFTDEYLPEQRSHLYGITAVYPYCPGGKAQENPPPRYYLTAFIYSTR